MKKDELRPSPKLARAMFQNVVKSLYISGDLKEENLRDKDAFLKAIEKVYNKIKIEGYVVDHTDALLSQAELYCIKSEYDYSRIFYATFFEHSTNQLIEIHCRNKKLSDNTRIDIIKNVNMYGKLTWLFELIALPRFNKKYTKIIKNLADDRNAFIHYKWSLDTNYDADALLEKKQNLDLEFKEIKMAVKYFKTYTSKLKFKNNKGKIDKLLKHSSVKRKQPTISVN